MKASLNNYRQAPRKVRLVVDSLRGKKVSEALASLRFMPKRSALPLSNLLRSAVANAKNAREGVSESELYIKTISVDKGITLHRHMPRAFGRATPIRKQTSKIALALGERDTPSGAKTKRVSQKVKKEVESETKEAEQK